MGRALWISLALTLLLGVIQVVSAISFDSLALVADAIHNLSDAVAVGLAVGAAWLAGLPATKTRTFGYRRAEILAATINALFLIALSVWVAWEAFARLADPRPVEGGGVALIGALAVVLNLVPVLLLLRAGARSN
ncbi:MAG: cation transporter, partial [Thermoleophilia bacterium]|nr:cation transporter [Thermoleophilia bacterium]